MKKFFALSMLMAGLLLTYTVEAGSGIFQTYIVTDVNSGGNGFLAGGINSDAAGSYNGTNFGSVTSFTLNGGEIKTFKNSISDVTGAEIFYSIELFGDPHTSFTAINLPHDADLGGGDQKWKEEFAGVDVLSGLPPGSYELQVWWVAHSSDGDHFDSDFGANFTGFFSIPCPSCDDGNVCTDDACVDGVGCVNTANGVSCDDGDPNTTGDVCSGGVCTPGTTATVPTLGQWGLILFGLMLLCSGAIVIWRRQFKLKEAKA